MKNCKYMEGSTCNFKHETTHEDCTLCIMNVILKHTNVMLESICEMNIKFGNARNIYIAFSEMKKTQTGLVKLMKEAHPDAIERASAPKDNGGLIVA